ncbi:MAG: ASCH domain-containing protein [Candidatus Aenigmarchaeota archaeon]|nr:ASCH domain-containing protein [Candidatus Aenigmarchaeota archaeon]
MEHIAIMKKSWGLTEKILTGQKKIESRWYMVKQVPWNRIREGDVIYFKNSGEPVTIRAEAEKIVQFQDLNPQKVVEILEEYGSLDGLEKAQIPKFFSLFKDKKYCTLVFLKNTRRTEPFEIDKSGFGSMSAWITIDSVEKLRKK